MAVIPKGKKKKVSLAKQYKQINFQFDRLVDVRVKIYQSVYHDIQSVGKLITLYFSIFKEALNKFYAQVNTGGVLVV